MIGGGPFGFAPGEWTDDTSMAIAIAEAVRSGADLLDEFTQDQLVARWVDWSVDAKDMGTQTRAVLGASRRLPGAAAARQHAKDVHEQAGRSAGNGSLMRTGPVALAYLNDPDRLAEAARSISGLTHYDRDAGDACVLWCLAIRHAIEHGEFDVRVGLPWLPDDQRDRWAGLITEAESRQPRDFPHNGWVVEAFQAAWSAIVTTQVPVEDPVARSYSASHLQFALEAAVRGGNDTDTVAAIAGSLLGARWGVSAVPLHWQRDLHGWPDLRYRDLIELAADRGSEPEPPTYEALAQLRLATIHPHDPDVVMGGINAAHELPVTCDAVVSLCRSVSHLVPVGLTEQRNHVEVWLIDKPGHDANPHVQFVLDQAARAVQDMRSEGRRVFLHCAAGQSRTPAVGAIYGANVQDVLARDELAKLLAIMPDSRVGEHFIDAIDERDGLRDRSSARECAFG